MAEVWLGGIPSFWLLYGVLAYFGEDYELSAAILRGFFKALIWPITALIYMFIYLGRLRG